jgi:hypothetical protein
MLDELRFVLFGQASQHEPEHGEIDHGLTTAGQILIILAHATIATYPCQSSLNDPATLPPDAVFCFRVEAIVLSFRDSLV